MRRNELLAYLIGAAVAGTGLVLPYTARALAPAVFPHLLHVSVPFFLLPIPWGLWNWLYVRLDPPVGIAAWGAVLGFVLAVGVNLLLWARGQWFPAFAVMPVFLSILYALIWLFVVGPLNDALGVDGTA